MRNVLLVILVMVVVTQCTSEKLSSEKTMDSFLGRWDVVASQGGTTYPLWFQLNRFGEKHEGVFQPKGGHARPIENVSVNPERLKFSCCGFELEGSFSKKGLIGRGMTQGKEFSWKARRAPELPAAESLSWGQPIDLLADGLEGWKVLGEDQGTWKLDGGELINTGKGSNIYTKKRFQDFKLHIEVNCPEGSNSGIYLRGRYEIQVQDDYGKVPHNRHMGGVYGQLTPTQNSSRRAGEWQEFDVVLSGRWVTVILNGTKIINHKEIPGITGGALDSSESESGPIYLQGDHGAVSYRNIVLTPAMN